MRLGVLCCALCVALQAAEIPVELKTPSDGARITNPYDPRDLEIELRVTWRKPGSVLDTVGINAAPTGSMQLVQRADGTLSAQVYDNSRRGGANVGNGWHVWVHERKVPQGEATKVIWKLKDGRLALLVGDHVKRWDCPTALSGQPIFIGDFKGDESWGSKYNIHQGMVGQVVLVYFGKSRGTGGAAPAPSPQPGGGAASAAPATPPIIDEAGLLDAGRRTQLASDLAALRAKGVALGLVVARTPPRDAGAYRKRLMDAGLLPAVSGVLVDCPNSYTFQYDSRFPTLLSAEQVDRAWKAAGALPHGMRLLAVTGTLLGRTTAAPTDPVQPADPVQQPDPIRPVETQGQPSGSLAGDAGGLEAALKAGDAARAVQAMAPEAGARCKALFTQQPQAMAQLAALLATKRLVAQGVRLAEYEVTEQGRRYPLMFELIDGRWCLSRF